MYRLLSSAEKRHMHLLEYLNRQRREVSLEDIVDALEVSKKTILSDFAYFDEEFQKLFFISTSETGGYRLFYRYGYNIKTCYKAIYKKSLTIQFVAKLFFKPGRKIKDWAHELYLSENTIYRMIKQFNEAFSDIDIHIITNEVSIQGAKEAYTRLFAGYFFEEVFDLYYWPFLDIDQEVIVQMADSFPKKYGRILTERQIHRISIITAMSFLRMNQGFLIKEDVTIHNEQAIMEHEEQMTEKLQAAIDFPLYESWKTELAATVMFFNIAWDSEGEKQRTTEFANDFIDVIQEKLKIKLIPEARENLINGLLGNYTLYKIFPFEGIFVPRNPFLQTARLAEQYPDFIKVVHEELQKLEKKTQFPFNSKLFYVALETLFAEWEFLTVQLDKKRTPVRILAASSLSVTHSSNMKEILQTQFFYKVQVDVYKDTLYSLKKKSDIFDDYDIVITDLFMPELPLEKLFLTDVIFSDKQLLELENRIRYIQLKSGV